MLKKFCVAFEKVVVSMEMSGRVYIHDRRGARMRCFHSEPADCKLKLTSQIKKRSIVIHRLPCDQIFDSRSKCVNLNYDQLKLYQKVCPMFGRESL
jgi:hypothetical protein